MSELQVASRYAKSLIDLAEEQNVLEVVRTDMESFLETLRENPTLKAVLKNPIIGPDKKSGILTGIFGPRLHPMIMSFFAIVVRKGRSEVLFETAKEFINAYNLRKNIVKATVTSAAPLNEQNRKEIEAVIKQATKGEIILTANVDPSLIGGFVLKVGDRQFDTSISTQLNKLKKEFSQKGIF
jgi:F-type H+-transporting ATPase subunit delta